MREIATGTALLLSPGLGRGPWLWGRVLGDVVDVVTLAGSVRRSNPNRWNALGTLVSVLGITAVDVLAARSPRPITRSQVDADLSELPRPPVEMRGTARLR